MNILKVASSTDAKKLSDAIKHFIDEKQQVELQAVGAAAINNLVKAIAILNFTSDNKIALEPSFKVYTIDGKERTGYSIILK